MQLGNPQNWKRDETLISVTNPLSDDFVFTYRNDDNQEQQLIIPFYKTVHLPVWQATRAIEKLTDALANERKLGYLSPEKRAELRKEVTG